MKLYRIVGIALLVFMLAISVSAQDSTGSIAQNNDAIVNLVLIGLQAVITFAFEHNVQWLLVLIGVIWLPPQWVVDTAKAFAGRTPNPYDDKAVAVWEAARKLNPVTPAIFEDIESKNENNPPVTINMPSNTGTTTTGNTHTDIDLDTTPVAPIPELTFYRFDLDRYETRRDYEPDRQVHVPPKAMYTSNVTNGTTHPNVNIDAFKHTEFAIDSISGEFGYTFDPVRLADGVTYEIALEFFADVHGKEPLSEWLWLDLLKDGDSLEQVHGITNGTHSAVWTVAGDGKLHAFTPRNVILWANASGSSVIQWHKFTVSAQKKA